MLEKRVTLAQSHDVSSSSEDGGSVQGSGSVALAANVAIDEAFVSGAWGVGTGSGTHPNVVTRGTRRLLSRDQIRCQFCEFPFNSSVSSAQHMARHHPGCGRQMDDVRCGGLLRDNYVLCPSCMIFYSNTVPAAAASATVAAAMTVSEAAAAAARRRGVPATAQRSCSISSSVGGGRERSSRKGKAAAGYSITARARKGRKGSIAEAGEGGGDADAPDLLVVDWDDLDAGDGEEDVVTPLEACRSAIADLSNLSELESDVMSAIGLSRRVARANSDGFIMTPPCTFETLPGRAGKDPLGQASVIADPRKSALGDTAGNLGGGGNPVSLTPSLPLWVQASRLRSRSDNVKALRRLDDLGRFQLSVAAVNVALERASARVQCGKTREAARMMAACGMGELPQLYSVLRTLEDIEVLTGGERANACGNVRWDTAMVDSVEVQKNALKAIVVADPAALRVLSVLCTRELMAFVGMADGEGDFMPSHLTIMATEVIVDILGKAEASDGNDITGIERAKDLKEIRHYCIF